MKLTTTRTVNRQSASSTLRYGCQYGRNPEIFKNALCFLNWCFKTPGLDSKSRLVAQLGGGWALVDDEKISYTSTESNPHPAHSRKQNIITTTPFNLALL